MNGNLPGVPDLHMAPSLPLTAQTALPELPAQPSHQQFEFAWWQQGQAAAQPAPPPRAAPAAVALPAQPPGFTEAAHKEPPRTKGSSGSGMRSPGMQAAQSDTFFASQVTLRF